jgi:hypothetical protein
MINRLVSLGNVIIDIVAMCGDRPVQRQILITTN